MVMSFDPVTKLCNWHHLEVTGKMAGRVVAGFDSADDAYKALPSAEEIRRRVLVIKSRGDVIGIDYVCAYENDTSTAV